LGGLAHQAGIRLGDAFVAVNGQKVSPPDEPRFQLGQTQKIPVQAHDETGTRQLTLQVPNPMAKDRPPMVTPVALAHEVLPKSIGLMRVAAFPGAVGFDFARNVDQVVTRFKGAQCDRLIVDLRGNPGGGLGSPRLMSYLVPDRRPTGYSLTRKGRARGRTFEDLMRIVRRQLFLPTGVLIVAEQRIQRIPKTKFGLYAMAFRFGLLHRDRSLSLRPRISALNHSMAGQSCCRTNSLGAQPR
jgi:C-terminal processing protease CtpA/Prc